MSATSPLCPFCRKNNLFDAPIIAETQNAYLAENARSPGCYLIIPEAHIESPQELAVNWWGDVKVLLTRIADQMSDYNISLNVGAEAGQSVKHMHFWIVPRYAGRRSSGKGLAGLMSEIDRQAAEE